MGLSNEMSLLEAEIPYLHPRQRQRIDACCGRFASSGWDLEAIFAFEKETDIAVHKARVDVHVRWPCFVGSCLNRTTHLEPSVLLISIWPRVMARLVGLLQPFGE